MDQVTANAIFGSLGRIEAQLEALDDRISVHLDDDNDIHLDVETRVRSLEKFRWAAAGSVAVIAAVFTAGVTYAKDWLP